MHANYCTWCLVTREVVNDGFSPAEFKFKEGHSIINLPITIFNKSEVDQAEDAEITIYVNTLPSESLKKIHWSNFHFSRCGGAALGIVWI